VKTLGAWWSMPRIPFSFAAVWLACLGNVLTSDVTAEVGGDDIGDYTA
jgi:hypothetical protein